MPTLADLAGLSGLLRAGLLALPPARALPSVATASVACTRAHLQGGIGRSVSLVALGSILPSGVSLASTLGLPALSLPLPTCLPDAGAVGALTALDAGLQSAAGLRHAGCLPL